MLNKVKKSLRFILAGWILLFSVIQAQEKRMDGVVGIIGQEIILDSDLIRFKEVLKGAGKSSGQCDVIKNLIAEKVLLNEARKDTLIFFSEAQVKAQVKDKIADLKKRNNNEKALFADFGVENQRDLEAVMLPLMEDNLYAQAKRASVTRGVKPTPKEVKDFYQQHQVELAGQYVGETVILSQLVIKPEIKNEQIQAVKDQLLSLKEQIDKGADFGQLAYQYSIDPSVRRNYGSFKGIKKGQFVKPFEDTARALEEGQISDPVKTDFGYHIIRLDKKDEDQMDVSHILMKAEPTAEQLIKAKEQLVEIMAKIKSKKLSFEQAILRYSTDKDSKFNRGIVQDPSTGSNRIERSKLPLDLKFAIGGLLEAEMSDVFIDELAKEAKVLKLVAEVAGHALSVEEDYATISRYAENQIKEKKLTDFLINQEKNTVINLIAPYNICVN